MLMTFTSVVALSDSSHGVDFGFGQVQGTQLDPPDLETGFLG